MNEFFVQADEMMQSLIVWMIALTLIGGLVFWAFKSGRNPLAKFVKDYEYVEYEWKEAFKRFFTTSDRALIPLISFGLIVVIIIGASFMVADNKQDVITAEAFMAFGFHHNQGESETFLEALDFRNTRQVDVRERVTIKLRDGQEFKATLKEVYVKQNEYVFSYSVSGVKLVYRGALSDMVVYFKDTDEFEEIVTKYEL